MVGGRHLIACSTLYNDKGYGDRSLLFFSFEDDEPAYVGRIDDVADDCITNLLRFENNKLAVLSLTANLRVVEFTPTIPCIDSLTRSPSLI